MTAPHDTLDELIDEVTVDCYGEDEQMSGFLTAIEEVLTEPVAATVVGAPVELLAIEYDGNPLRGLVASCRRGEATYHVSVLDIDVADSPLKLLLTGYLRWLLPGRQ